MGRKSGYEGLAGSGADMGRQGSAETAERESVQADADGGGSETWMGWKR